MDFAVARHMSNRSLISRVEIVEEQAATVQTELREFRGEVRQAFVKVRNEFRTDLSALETSLRVEIQNGDEETRRQMRVLHEDVISRLALLQEGLDSRNKSPRSRRS